VLLRAEMGGSVASAPAGSISGIVMKVGPTMVSRARGTAIKELQEFGHKQTSEWLEHQLAKLRATQGIQNLGFVKDMGPEERRQWLVGSNIIDDLMNQDVREQDKPIIQGMALRILDDRLKASVEIQILAQPRR
jgi:hypothetical protein